MGQTQPIVRLTTLLVLLVGVFFVAFTTGRLADQPNSSLGDGSKYAHLQSLALAKGSQGPPCSPQAKVEGQRDVSGREAAWVQSRRQIVEPALAKFLQVPQSWLRAKEELPLLGFAFSGGGWRAVLTDLGHVIGANQSNPAIPGIENLWNAVTYQSGISGGSWFMTSFTDLAESPRAFLKDIHLRLGMSFLNVPGGFETWFAIAEDIHYASPEVPESIMNLYGPLVGSHFLTWNPPHPQYPSFEATPVGIYERLSGKLAENIANHSIPFPLIVAIHVDNDEPIPDYPEFFEFSPYQTGSITPGREGYIASECFNTPFSAGSIPTGVTPYSGDNIALIIGTSGSGPFALSLHDVLVLGCESVCGSGCYGLCKWIERQVNNTAYERFYPGIFNNFLRGTGVVGNLNELSEIVLIDSGVVLNIPFMPLLSRGVKYIFAVDASMSAIGGGPRGHNLVAFADYSNKFKLPFPFVPSEYSPDTDDWVLPKSMQGRPLIFGANDPNPNMPTIIYLPLAKNSSLTPDWPDFDPYFIDTQTSFSKKEIDTMIELNVGLIQNGELIESIRCVMLKDLGLPTNGCKCSPNICWTKNGTDKQPSN